MSVTFFPEDNRKIRILFLHPVMNLGGGQEPVPVSYTHLDVYKRQVLMMSFVTYIFPFSGTQLMPAYEFAALFVVQFDISVILKKPHNGVPVSYTHLSDNI